LLIAQSVDVSLPDWFGSNSAVALTLGITAFRSMMGMSQAEFVASLGINPGTLRNWEQGHRKPDGPASALLRLAARHPRLLMESLAMVN
jgi:putative transcriptional regulator